MKKTVSVFIAIMICFFCTSCRSGIVSSSNTSASTTATTPTTTSKPTATTPTQVLPITTMTWPTEDFSHIGQIDKDAINVLFIGNSLLFVPKIPEKFKALSEYLKKPVNVYEKTAPGYKLSQHLDELKNERYADLIKSIDIVILQEYGSKIESTPSSVQGIQKLFKANTKFYFMLTEFDVGDNLTNELKKVNNLTYILSGYAHDLMLKDNGYTYNQLHYDGDYHPNDLYGYISTLTIYSTLFNTSCVGLSYDWLDKDTIAMIPGNNTKDSYNQDIENTVMKAIHTDPSKMDSSIFFYGWRIN